MPRKKRTGPLAERYIDATLELIVKHRTSTEVNVREISRRLGCAHTNIYNYFEDRDDLLWAALRRALAQYAEGITAGLDSSLSGHAYFRRLIENMVGWALENPGLYRFISLDPLDPSEIPTDIMQNVIEMKGWLTEVFKVLALNRIGDDQVSSLVDILIAYMDGEIFNLMNGRVLPGEDIVGRVTGNMERLFTLLTAQQTDGIDLARVATAGGALTFPTLKVTPVIPAMPS